MPTTSTLDVYRDWLGIEETARPLNHYQLLRLTQFEDDASKYPQRYRRMTGHVRKFAPAEHAELAKKLIKEVVGAMLCLADARRKREYDRKLGRPEDGRPRRRTMEQVLVERNAISPEELTKAKNFALAVGFELRDALIQRKLASQEAIMSAYAESVGLPYLEARDIHPDEALVAQVPAVLARKNSCVPLTIDDDQLLVVAPFPLAPKAAEELYDRFRLTVRTVLCAPTVVNDLLNRHYSRVRPEIAARVAKHAVDTPKQEAPEPAKSPSSPENRRTESVAAALAELQAASRASRGEDEDQAAAKAAVKTLAKSEPASADVQQFRQMVAFAAFSIAATIFQTSYTIYAFVFYHPYHLSVFWLGWFVSAAVAALVWGLVKLLTP